MKLTNRHNLTIIAITLLAFGGYYFLNELFFTSLYNYLKPLIRINTLSFFLTYLIIGSPLFATVLYLHKTTGFLESLGLSAPFFKAIIVALICTAPMFAGYAFLYEWNQGISWSEIFVGAICAALFEELYYRGVLFGQLFRFSRLGFIPSIAIGSLIFAMGHLYQSSDPATIIGIFITTFMGAVLFSWAYSEWNHNLWVPIFLHLFMNLSWMLFSAGDNAFGGLHANLFRFATIATLIIGTVLYKRKKGAKLAINRKSLWIQPAN